MSKRNFTYQVNYAADRINTTNADGTVTTKLDNKVMEYIQKFDNYFYYAINTKGIDVTPEAPACSVNSPCGPNGPLAQCCVDAVIRND